MLCSGFRLSLTKQAEEIIAAFDENKWYLSEKAGEDVGDLTSQIHFLRYHVHDWAENWRKEWCQNRCPYKGNCNQIFKTC